MEGLNNSKFKHEYLMDIEKNALLVINSWKDRQTIILCEETRKVKTRDVIKIMTFFYIECPS